eukprot:GSA25T00004964001.1
MVVNKVAQVAIRSMFPGFARRSSEKLFDEMLKAVLRAPIHWFDSISVGTLLTRFSFDVEQVDSTLPVMLFPFLIFMSWNFTAIFFTTYLLFSNAGASTSGGSGPSGDGSGVMEDPGAGETTTNVLSSPMAMGWIYIAVIIPLFLGPLLLLLSTARRRLAELQQLENMPAILSLFSETCLGSTTIRVFERQGMY